MGQGRRHAARGPAGARGGRPRTCVRLCCAARAASCASASASAVGTCWRTSAAPRACSAAAHSLPSHARTTPWPWPAPARPRVEPGALLERQEPPSARPVSATERAGRALHATQQGATRDTAVRCVKDAVQRRAALAPRPARLPLTARRRRALLGTWLMSRVALRVQLCGSASRMSSTTSRPSRPAARRARQPPYLSATRWRVRTAPHTGARLAGCTGLCLQAGVAHSQLWRAGPLTGVSHRAAWHGARARAVRIMRHMA